MGLVDQDHLVFSSNLQVLPRFRMDEKPYKIRRAETKDKLRLEQIRSQYLLDFIVGVLFANTAPRLSK